MNQVEAEIPQVFESEISEDKYYEIEDFAENEDDEGNNHGSSRYWWKNLIRCRCRLALKQYKDQ